MGVSVNDMGVAVHWCTAKHMWEPASWCPGGVNLVMLVIDGQPSHLVTKLGQET